MARKAVGNKGKRSDILKAAYRCFLKNGYDGTSIREIMKEAEAEVGLFYYYFDGKDDVFREAQTLFVDEYLSGVEDIVATASVDSFRVLSNLFQRLHDILVEFHQKYEEKLHPSVTGSLRDMLLSRYVIYIKRVLDELVKKGARLQMDTNTLAQLLTYGVGGILIHNQNENFAYSAEVRKCINAIMGLSREEAMIMIPQYAREEDMGEIMLMLAQQGKSIDTSNMIQRLERKEVLYVRDEQQICGCIIFEKESGELLTVCVKKGACEELARNVLTSTAKADILFQK